MPSTRTLALAGAAALLLAGGAVTIIAAGGDDEAPATTTASVATTSTTTTVATTTTTIPLPQAPLTGLPMTEVPDRPALVVKIDNADRLARPQSGLNQADIVYEERVEGGVTRFAAVFHSQGAPVLGPIRSGRTTDVGLTANLQRPLFAYSGANAGILRTIRGSDLIDVGFDNATSVYVRRSDRRAPDNLYSATDDLWAAAPEDTAAPTALFDHRADGAPLPPTAVAAAGVDISFTGAASVPVRYDWDADQGLWLRTQQGTPHVDEDGIDLSAHTVIVQYVRYVNTGYTDVAGNPVPEAELYGFGDGIVLLDGHAIEASWGRGGPGEPTNWIDADGTPIEIDPGRTWVHLVPDGNATIRSCSSSAPVHGAASPTAGARSTSIVLGAAGATG